MRLSPAIVVCLFALFCVLPFPTAAVSGNDPSSIIRQLKDADSGVRMRAARQLGSFNGLRVIDALTAALDDPNPGVRQEAAHALGTQWDLRVVDALATALRDADRTVRFSAATALLRYFDPRGEDILIDALQQGSEMEQSEAIHSLAAIGDARARDALAGVMRQGKPRMRVNAIFALQGLQDARATDAMIELLKSDDQAAIEMLFSEDRAPLQDPRLIEPVITWLKGNQRMRSQGVSPVLYRIGKAAVGPLKTLSEDPNNAIRSWAVRNLGSFLDRDVAEVLIGKLRDESAAVRSAAAAALASPRYSLKEFLPYPQAIDPLITACSDPEASVRTSAASSLVRYDDPRVVETIISVLKLADDRGRKAIYSAIAMYPDRRYIPLLQQALKEPDPAVQMRAVTALSGLRDPQAVEILCNLLQNWEKMNPNDVVSAMKAVSGPRAAGLLLGILLKRANEQTVLALTGLQDARYLGTDTRQCGDPLFSNAAVHLAALGKPGIDALAVALRDPQPLPRMTAAAALSRFGDARAVPLLCAALRDENPVVRRIAAHALGCYGDVRALQPLKDALADIDAPVRAKAAWALGKLQDARAVDVLVKAWQFSDADTRFMAAYALGVIAHPHAAAPLLERLATEPDAGARQQAIRALGKIRDPNAIDPLLTILNDAIDPSRGDAAFALGELKIRRALLALIELAQDDSFPPPRLSEPINVQNPREDAIIALGKIADPLAIPALLAILQGPSPRLSFSAATALKAFPEPQVVEALHAFLLDTRAKIFPSAANAAFGSLLCMQPAPVETIFAVVKEKDPWAGAYLLRVLNGMSSQVAAEALPDTVRTDRRFTDAVLALLDSRDDFHSREAMTAVVSLKDAKAIEPLIARLNSHPVWERGEIMAALGEVGGPRVVEVLKPLLTDADPLTRASAGSALAQMKDPAALPVLLALMNAGDYTRRVALRGLGNSGEAKAIDALAAQLTGDDAQAAVVIDALGKIDDPRSTALLVSVPGNERFSPALRRQAIDLLRLRKAAGAVDALIAALQDPWCPIPVRESGAKVVSVRAAAVRALGDIGDQRAVDPLIAVLEQGPPDDRHTAVLALKILTGQDFGTDAAKWREWRGK